MVNNNKQIMEGKKVILFCCRMCKAILFTQRAYKHHLLFHEIDDDAAEEEEEIKAEEITTLDSTTVLVKPDEIEEEEEVEEYDALEEVADKETLIATSIISDEIYLRMDSEPETFEMIEEEPNEEIVTEEIELQEVSTTSDDRTKYHCDSCDYQTVIRSNYKRHKKSCLKKFDQLTCKQCGKLFKKRTGYHRHIKEVHGDKRYKCFCDKSFARKEHLDNHQRLLHDGNKS